MEDGFGFDLRPIAPRRRPRGPGPRTEDRAGHIDRCAAKRAAPEAAKVEFAEETAEIACRAAQLARRAGRAGWAGAGGGGG